ncbi:MAG: hypothetical protein ACI861_000057 [Paracoccaceae bacterium]|jgi:hypothetical protein
MKAIFLAAKGVFLRFGVGFLFGQNWRVCFKAV